MMFMDNDLYKRIDIVDEVSHVLNLDDNLEKDCISLYDISLLYKDVNAKYLFSTIQMMSKEDVFTNFRRDQFDYIVIDEEENNYHDCNDSLYVNDVQLVCHHKKIECTPEPNPRVYM